jgi:hypothetical protein
MVALLYEVDPNGGATVITRGAYRLPLAPDGAQVAFDLYPQDHVVAAGNRLGLLLTAADDFWFEGSVSGTPVDVTGGALHVPVLRHVPAGLDPVTNPYPFKPGSRPGEFQLDPATIAARTNPDAACC